ncbi:rhox homeobox family member 2 [Fukomys damarensis]|uniref:rhox homeobox family member 2 n=1 Tax=Fukomys damarensis TaxID=885580 RepID=UPI00053F78C9|nr:rhox homeobox family member 2 [Fukomys damarensis]
MHYSRKCGEDMASPPEMSLEDEASQSPGVLELRGEGPDMKPRSTCLVEAGQEDGKKFPEQGAPEGEGDCVMGLGAPGPKKEDKETLEDSDVTSLVVPGDVWEEDREEDLLPERAAAAGEGRCPKKEDEQQEGRGSEQEPGQEQLEGPCLLCDVLCRLQLQQVERIFQRTQYPDVFARKEVSIPTCVTDATVKPRDPENDSP